MDGESKPALRLCPVCRGSGIDTSLHSRFTTGGGDDRSCPRCQGACYIEVEEADRRVPKKS